MRHLNDFHTSVICGLAEMGYEMHIACRDADTFPYEYKRVEIPFSKSYFSIDNIRSFFRLRSLIKRENIDVVSTHTALAGFVTRIAVKTIKSKKRPNCLHTAHGYLFGKNSLISGRFTYIFERLCKSVTDLIMTMNTKDNKYAKRLVKKNGKVVAIQGMGVDNSRYFPAEQREKEKLRETLHLPDGIIIFCAAEFSRRKNHETLIRAMRGILRELPNAFLLLAGDGARLGKILRLAVRLGVEKNVIFLGYVKDTAPYLRASDIAVSASFSEGLPIGISEAIACGLPVTASRVKGHSDMLPPYILFNPRSPKEAARRCIEAVLVHANPSRGEYKVISKDEAAKEILEIYSNSHTS
jgi:glycosyltransferase EpsD